MTTSRDHELQADVVRLIKGPLRSITLPNLEPRESPSSLRVCPFPSCPQAVAFRPHHPEPSSISFPLLFAFVVC